MTLGRFWEVVPQTIIEFSELGELSICVKYLLWIGELRICDLRDLVLTS